MLLSSIRRDWSANPMREMLAGAVATFALIPEVIAFSFLSPCRLRLRRRQDKATQWERWAIDVQPRSVYLLRGPARHEWEHSIPPLEALRYSVTFRTLRDER